MGKEDWLAGPLVALPVDAVAFIRSSMTTDPWPDLQIYLASSDLFSKAKDFNAKVSQGS